jgi:signal transduction histidine kinase
VIGAPQPLGPITGQQVFSLIQESLNNVQKHAQARTAQIQLEWHMDQLDVIVTDDGIGFVADALPATGRYGLTMMSERAQELRGNMQLTSTPGAGTTVKFEIPLQPA